MKFFENLNYNGQWNWIDDNNVIVGYSLWSSCCEIFNYAYSFSEPNSLPVENEISIDNFDGYQFDIEYHKEITDPNVSEGNGVVFKLKSNNPIDLDLYLILTNYQNGYYSHGFDMKVNEQIIYEGSI